MVKYCTALLLKRPDIGQDLRGGEGEFPGYVGAIRQVGTGQCIRWSIVLPPHPTFLLFMLQISKVLTETGSKSKLFYAVNQFSKIRSIFFL